MQKPDFLSVLVFPFPYFPLTFSLLLPGWMEERGGEKRKGEGVDVLFSSAECAHMYEREAFILGLLRGCTQI